MRWLRKLLSRQEPPPAPVLMRVAESGGAPSTVQVVATWFPSGRSLSQACYTAEGLCVIPWRRNEERVQLAVRTVRGEARLDVERDRADDGRVHDVRIG